ncbi:hypothetical protein BKA65DRAFT_565829 [Rhexocercosporidium sp. MPI-PUGE-AT-0058]|nr:hypothetical protein BKA65DRAFT_565829 [Rhexocercosporidium sp. MPI-PUGE-AT-0058]
MPSPIPQQSVLSILPMHKLWRPAIIMSIGSHVYAQLGPSWGNLYISILVCILINIIGLGAAMQLRDHEFDKWLIQHFKRLREHQYRETERCEEAKEDMAEVVRVCKEFELESLLSYPHEHTTDCERNCMLRYCDIFVVFGENRATLIPPRFARNKLASEKINIPSLAEETSDGIETDATGLENERDALISGIYESPHASRSRSFESVEEMLEGVADRETGQTSGSSNEINPHECSETDGKGDGQHPKKNTDYERSDNERGSGEERLDRLLDQMWQEEIVDEERLKSIEAEGNNKINPAVQKSGTQQSVAGTTKYSPQVKEGADTGKAMGPGSQEDVRDVHTPELKKFPNSPKVKGPSPQKKKAKKKW